jgi:hypothetical protein
MTSRVLVAVWAATTIALAGCSTTGKTEVGSAPVTNPTAPTDGTSRSTTTESRTSTSTGTKETTTTETTSTTRPGVATVSPKRAQASDYVGGNVDPMFPSGDPGKLSVVAVGKPDGQAPSISFVVRNNTAAPLYAIEAVAKATSGGKLVGSGDARNVEPVVIAPGEIGFGYVYFSNALPATATVEVTATGEGAAPKYSGRTPLIIGETNLVKGDYGDQLVGEVQVAADAEKAVEPPVAVTALCVDAAGKLAGAQAGYTDGKAMVAPGASATYSVDLFAPCPTFLIGASGYSL